jgi:hypothetical protein
MGAVANSATIVARAEAMMFLYPDEIWEDSLIEDAEPWRDIFFFF